MTGAATVRPAAAADIAAIGAIYGWAVRESIATFDTLEPAASHWSELLGSSEIGDHFLVVEEAGALCGYAYSHAFRPRPAYALTRETSVYLDPRAFGRGLGTLIYSRLLHHLHEDGIHRALAVISQPNPASVALHESLGFELIGTFGEVGRKFDQWIDTRWYQLRLESWPAARAARSALRPARPAV